MKKNFFCQKMVFCVYLAKYTHFGKNKDILRSHEKKNIFCQKIVFCVYLAKYTHFGKNNDILRSPEKNLCLSNNRFLPLSAKIYTFRQI